jgi:hypothetical protein
MHLQQAQDLIDVSIQKMMAKKTNLELGPIMRVYNEEVAEDYYEKDSGLSGFGEAARLTENAIITSESPVQTFDQTYTQVFHGKLAAFTMQDWKYGIRKRKLEGVVNDLVGAANRKKERLLTEYLEKSKEGTNSYSVSDGSGNWTKTLTGGDSLPLIHTAHTREDGGATWNNEVTDGSTANMDFALNALKAAYRTGSLIVDPKGNLMDVNYDLFVFRKGSDISFTAMEINGALARGRQPQSPNRDGNPFGAFEILTLPYLSTDASAYYWGFDTSLMGDMHGLQCRTSQGVELDSPHIDYKTKTIYVSSTMAFDYGHNDARNVCGSDGTNS